MRIFRAPNIAAVLFCLPWFAGCASVGQVAESGNHTGVYSYRHRVDSFAGLATDEVRGVFNVTVPSWIPMMFTQRAEPFTVRRSVGPDSDAPYYNVVVYYNGADEDRMGLVPAGQTLTLVLDGMERIPLAGDGSVSGRGSYSSDLYEVATYSVTRRQLEHMVSAKNVQIKLDGDRGSETGVMEPALHKRIKGLLSRFER